MRIKLRDNNGVCASTAQFRTGRAEWSSFVRARAATAFTLLEVMIAMGIFFMAVFAILGLVSSNLRAARRLTESTFDPAKLLIAQLYATPRNQVREGSGSGDFDDVGGETAHGYKWESQTNQVATNGLCQVEYLITPPAGRGKDQMPIHLTLYIWGPNASSPLGPGGGGPR
jgi:type II secretion system protein I